MLLFHKHTGMQSPETFIKQSKRTVANLDLDLARFCNLDLDLELKTDFQSCTWLA